MAPYSATPDERDAINGTTTWNTKYYTSHTTIYTERSNGEKYYGSKYIDSPADDTGIPNEWHGQPNKFMINSGP